MEKFIPITSHVVPLLRDNVDTDQIIPARFLKVTDKNGLGEKLFSDWRYLADGTPNPDFPLNLASARGAELLLAGHNFGSGSSREHAPWALRAWGLRAVIALSFADIFRNNSLKNGLLPVQVDASLHAAIARLVEADPRAQLNIDLVQQQVTLPDGLHGAFPIEPFSKYCLLEGIDELDYILGFNPDIEAYEKNQRRHG
ncbi:MAG: 3-isopropylmalate dehydratase small subunit [Myxococcales bacterium]|nr:3-isopropylmalate dehydratase small subunit [Myxococcales bacterium]